MMATEEATEHKREGRLEREAYMWNKAFIVLLLFLLYSKQPY